MSAALLEVEGLLVERAGRRLLNEVDLCVERGEIHALLGANGAGKSTLLGALLGRTPFRGTIRFRWSSGGRVGHVPQAFEVDRTLPIRADEFLALERQAWPLCLGIRAATRRRIAPLLERVGLEQRGERPLSVLSGGELRRLLIANAIEPAPELLICDEPASGLDAAFLPQLDELLLELRAQHGTTVLLVSHDHQQVLRLADRATLLVAGRARSGPVGELLAAAGAAG